MHAPPPHEQGYGIDAELGLKRPLGQRQPIRLGLAGRCFAIRARWDSIPAVTVVDEPVAKTETLREEADDQVSSG